VSSSGRFSSIRWLIFLMARSWIQSQWAFRPRHRRAQGRISGTFNGPSWSIGAETTCYLVFATVLLLTASSQRRAILILCSTIAAGLLIRLISAVGWNQFRRHPRLARLWHRLHVVALSEERGAREADWPGRGETVSPGPVARRERTLLGPHHRRASALFFGRNYPGIRVLALARRLRGRALPVDHRGLFQQGPVLLGCGRRFKVEARFNRKSRRLTAGRRRAKCMGKGESKTTTTFIKNAVVKSDRSCLFCVDFSTDLRQIGRLSSGKPPARCGICGGPASPCAWGLWPEDGPTGFFAGHTELRRSGYMRGCLGSVRAIGRPVVRVAFMDLSDDADLASAGHVVPRHCSESNGKAANVCSFHARRQCRRARPRVAAMAGTTDRMGECSA